MSKIRRIFLTLSIGCLVAVLAFAQDAAGQAQGAPAAAPPFSQQIAVYFANSIGLMIQNLPYVAMLAYVIFRAVKLGVIAGRKASLDIEPGRLDKMFQAWESRRRARGILAPDPPSAEQRLSMEI
jgi:hypothetical protein